MKKILIILLLFYGMIMPINVYASSGALKSDSIITCNGKYYGKHGDGHWHEAVKKSGKWYPKDSAIYTNNKPCNVTTTSKKTTTTKKDTTTKKKTTSTKATTKSTTTTSKKTYTSTKKTIKDTSETTTITSQSTTKLTTKKITSSVTTTPLNDSYDTTNEDATVGDFVVTAGIGYGIYRLVKSKKKKL